MADIHVLATLTAERARKLGVRPNQVVLTICREAGIHASTLDDIKKLVLSECGRRGGKAPRVKKNTGWQLDFFLGGMTRKEAERDAALHEASLIAGIPEHDL